MNNAGFFLFCNESIGVVVTGKNGPVFTKYGSYDQRFCVAHIDEIFADGGDW